jgi:Ca-activated chloride channel homolog
VAAYRLIGYENRALRHEDFNDDRKDAGDIGAGHSVTALYEIVPAGVEVEGPRVDPLKYQPPLQPAALTTANELATVRLRYKAPEGDTSRLISTIVLNRVRPMSHHLGFASAVAEFGMLLRQSDYRGHASFRAVAARAKAFRGPDLEGYRAEFARLVDTAAMLTGWRRDDW